VKENIGRMEISLKPTKYSRTQTIIVGINPNLEKALKKLKKALCCGGFIKGDEIVLQGDHRQELKDITEKLRYSKNK